MATYKLNIGDLVNVITEDNFTKLMEKLEKWLKINVDLKSIEESPIQFMKWTDNGTISPTMDIDVSDLVNVVTQDNFHGLLGDMELCLASLLKLKLSMDDTAILPSTVNWTDDGVISTTININVLADEGTEKIILPHQIEFIDENNTKNNEDIPSGKDFDLFTKKILPRQIEFVDKNGKSLPSVINFS
jgi:hypothetical protein